MRYALIILVGLLPSMGSPWPWKKYAEASAPFLLLHESIGMHHFAEGISSAKAGNEKKARGHFEDAAVWWGVLWQDGIYAPGWYLNLGNAQFLADQLPGAILSFNRGLRLDPNDARLRANLDYARAKVQYPFANHGQPESDAWPSWLHRPSPNTVLLLGLACYSLACVQGTRWLMRRRPRLLVGAGVLLAVAVGLGIGWRVMENSVEEDREHPLVVIREDRLPLRRGNGPSYPHHSELPVLARGMEARHLLERGSWLQIQFASGEIGWVPRAAVLEDYP